MKNFLLLMSTFGLVGCSAFNVKTDAESLSGVPFYKKIGVTRQTTKFTRTWLEVKLGKEIVEDTTGKIIDSKYVTFQLDEDEWCDIKARSWLKARDANHSLESIAEDFTKQKEFVRSIDTKTIFEETDVASMIEKPLRLPANDPGHTRHTLIGNSVAQATAVDYSELHYFNVKIPPFASATASIKLHKDGTLSEANSSVDLSHQAEVIPAKEFFMEKLGLVKALDDPSKEPVMRLVLRVERRGFLYELVRDWPLSSPDPDFQPKDPLTAATADSIIRKKLASPKPPAADGIRFEGNIQLPKPAKP
ncbi:MAG: hypothetical protein DWQ01_10990 [Planctomycetota bacterium]|nr:MAG: hypothetical protein DWQ01_10990 [Planctomycetota bacterium]